MLISTELAELCSVGLGRMEPCTVNCVEFVSGTIALGSVGAELGWTELCVLSWVALVVLN